MKQRWLFIALIVALCCLLASCGPAGNQETEDVPTSAPTDAIGLPNPASVYCQEQGYKHEIRTAADGSQSGVCIFPDGSECDEWAFYRGECGPSSTPAASVGLPNPAAAYCQEQGYRYEIRTAADGSQSGVCIFADGSECDEWAFYRGECGPTRAVTPAASASLWLDKIEFQPGEEIQVHFSTPAAYPDDAWVGIIPSDVPHGSEATNDENYLDYEYLEGNLTGVLSFLAPLQPGSYDFRLHDTDNDGQEVASVTFTVVGGSEQPELWLDKTTFAPGEEIQLHFATPATFPDAAWVGIIPSDAPHGSGATNDEYDLAYEYLSGRVSGVFTFFAPDEPGSYDFRLHDTDDDGQEVASVTFQVTGQ